MALRLSHLLTCTRVVKWSPDSDLPAKKHHYVPAFYQRGFGDAELMVWRYDRRLREYKQLAPKVNCREEDLYAVRAADGTWDRRIETDVLSKIDGAAATVIQNLSPGQGIDRFQLRTLVMFIALQHTRLPSFGRAVRNITESVLNEAMRMRFATLERAEEALAQTAPDTGSPRVTAKSIMEAVLNKKVTAKASEKVFIKNMFEMANELGLRLEHSDWTILIAPERTAFIVCDNPFVPIPPQGSALDAIGIGSTGVVYYFPLTNRLCLKAVLGEFGFRYRNIDSRAVRTINHNVAAHSERFVMAASREHLETVIARSGCTAMEPRGRYSAEVIKPDADNTFNVFTILPSRYFY
jgi:hypothetical protein